MGLSGALFEGESSLLRATTAGRGLMYGRASTISLSKTSISLLPQTEFLQAGETVCGRCGAPSRQPGRGSGPSTGRSQAAEEALLASLWGMGTHRALDGILPTLQVKRYLGGRLDMTLSRLLLVLLLWVRCGARTWRAGAGRRHPQQRIPDTECRERRGGTGMEMLGPGGSAANLQGV